VTCDRSVDFSSFYHQYNWPPRYNWNIVESGWTKLRLKELSIQWNNSNEFKVMTLDCMFIYILYSFMWYFFWTNFSFLTLQVMDKLKYSPLTLWVRIPFKGNVLHTTFCDKDCQWLVTGRWFSPGIAVFSTNKTDRHDIAKILLKVALNIPDNRSPCFNWFKTGFELTTLVVIGTDCIGSNKSNYHMIMTARVHVCCVYRFIYIGPTT
jgi:hypothetical protein